MAADLPARLAYTAADGTPRELVYRAWLDPAQLAAWAGPQGFRTPHESIVVEPHPGGRYASVMVSEADGDSFPSAGVFREVVLAPGPLSPDDGAHEGWSQSLDRLALLF